LALNLTGEIVEWQWNLDGLGVLEKTGKVSSGGSQTNRYIAPEVTGAEALDEVIIVTVKDRHGQEAQDQIFLKILAPTIIVAVTPTPTPSVPPRTEPPVTPETATAIPPPPTPTALPCIVKITDPLSQARVPMTTAAQGTVTPACEAGPTLWLMVEIGSRTWPQERVSGFPSGEGPEMPWLVTANVGGEDDAGKVFGLKVLSTNDRIDEEFAAWFLKGQETRDFPGFISQDLMDKGAKVLAGVVVVRN